MARGLLPEAVTAEDVIQACGGNLPPAPELPDSGEPLPEPEEASADYKPKPLPWWRKLGAVLTGTVSFLLFLSFMNVTDLTQLITADGMTELANHQMILYALFILSLFLFCYLHHPEIPPKGLCLTGTQGQAEAGQANRCGGCTSAADDPSDPVYRCVLSGQ